MSVLDEVLIEEYERCERIKQFRLNKLSELPQGYLSRKVIKGKEYYYLQWREGKKVVSQYVSLPDVEGLKKLIEERKKHQLAIRELEENQKKIRRVVGHLVDERL